MQGSAPVRKRHIALKCWGLSLRRSVRKLPWFADRQRCMAQRVENAESHCLVETCGARRPGQPGRRSSDVKMPGQARQRVTEVARETELTATPGLVAWCGHKNAQAGGIVVTI